MKNKSQHNNSNRTFGLRGMAALALVLVCASGAQAQKAAPGSGKIGAAKNAAAKPIKPPAQTALANVALPAALTYQFAPGAVYHFKVAAFFDGHFPPFAQPESDPVHFKADLGYAATVKKVDKEGATVEFVVENRELYLFQNHVNEDDKIDINDGKTVAIVSSLTTLEDMQKALNATAILRPDGSIVKILTNSTVKIPFDVGFDIRKLFLMMLPITFPTQAVKPGDTWPAADGLLGSKPGKTVYTDRLDTITAGANGVYRLSQTAHSTAEDKLDKAGNSTTKDEDVYRTLSGKADLTAEMTFVPAKPPANAPAPANPKAIAGQVKSAHLVLTAAFNRKRVKINPDQPEIPENDPLDVVARMTVVRVAAPAPAIAAPAKKMADGKTNSDKNTAKPGNKTALKTK